MEILNKLYKINGTKVKISVYLICLMFSSVPVATSSMSEKNRFFWRPPTYGICDLNDPNIKNHNCSIGVV